MNTEFKGTLGPWKVQDEFEEGKDYHVDSPQIYICNGDEQSHKPICDMGSMGIMNYMEELANANLIAAALELLNASICHSILEDYRNNPVADWVNDYRPKLTQYGFTGGLKDFSKWISDNRKAAIAKALNQ